MRHVLYMRTDMYVLQEYVLIGDLGRGEGCYSLNLEHPGYDRVPLDAVSAELLDAGA